MRRDNAWALALGGGLIFLLMLPVLALVTSTTPAQLAAGLTHPQFQAAVWLSLGTTLCSILLTVVLGTPLAWWLSRAKTRATSLVSVLVALPIVIPPAVVGVGLLQTFGPQGLLGPILSPFGITIPFTKTAVVLAQVVVSSPFYVQAATTAFRRVDPDHLAVARTLGASPTQALARVALPIALPGLLTGISLAWSRALGEFGATLLFAGNSPGRTQTMPLAIFSALESDVNLAVVFSLVLVAVGMGLLLGLQWLSPAESG